MEPAGFTELLGTQLRGKATLCGYLLIKRATGIAEVDLNAACMTLLMTTMQWAAVSVVLWLVLRVYECFPVNVDPGGRVRTG